MIRQRVSFDFCLSFVSRAGRCRKWMEFQQIAGMVNCEQPICRSLPLSQKCTVHKNISRCQSVHCSVSRGSADLCTYTWSPLGLILWTQPGTVQPGLHWCALICSYLNWMFNAFAVKLHWCTLVQSTLVYPWCALKSQEPVWCAGARHTACTTVPPALTTWAQLWHWTRRGLGGP